MPPRAPRLRARSRHLLLAAGLGLACQTDRQPPAGTASASASASSAPAPLPPRVDAVLLTRLREIAAACQVDAAAGTVTCPRGENRRLSTEFMSEKRARPAAVATLAYALSQSEPPLQAAAASLLNHAFRVPWGSEARAGIVEQTDARALLRASLGAPLPLARQAVPGAVHAAFLANLHEETFSALNHAPQTELGALGYRYVMTHGRLQAFPQVKQLATEANPALALAALEAPRNMYGWSETEAAEICPWAQGLLKEARPPVAARAAELLASCSGKHVDALLARGEALLRTAKLGSAELGPYRSLCSEAARREPARLSKPQCERNRQLLGDVVASPRTDAPVRATALQALAYQWPDAQTLRLARRLQRSDEPVLAEQAARVVKRLQDPAP